MSHDDKNCRDWSLSAGKINRFQDASIERLVAISKQAHMVNAKVRIAGEWREYEADWIKHLVPSARSAIVGTNRIPHGDAAQALSGRGADEAEMNGDKSGPLPGVGTGTRTPTSAPLSSDASITDPNNKALIGKKENVSITPRTDGLMVSLLNTDSTEQQKAESLIDFARQIERELAEAKAALSVATSDAGQVAMMLLQNDRDGAMQWARDIKLEWKTDGTPRLKLSVDSARSATVAWHPVSEVPPHTGKHYIVTWTYPGNEPVVTLRYYSMAGVWESPYVTSWMHLPDPYELAATERTDHV